jgi:ribose transport system ATP-binding protein
MVLLPADRQHLGSIQSLTVTENMMMQVLPAYKSAGVLRRGQLRHAAEQLSEDYDVRPGDPALTYSSLSGGNQQKALLAKWLQTSPSVLLLHEPTQGVDVGARHQIFERIAEAASRGTAVVCASSDYEQLAAICHRVLVFFDGAVAAELRGADVTKDHIAERAYLAEAPSHREDHNHE